MCVFLVCVLVLFRASVCAFRVSELLVVRLSFVVKRFCLRCVSCEIPRFSCRVLNSSFSFEFVVEFSIRVFDSSALNFRVEFWIRLFRFVALFDFSNFVTLFDFSNLTLNSSSNSTSRISCRISNSNLSSKFVVEIFVSLLYLISRISLWVCCQIRLLEFHCSIRFLEFRVFDSNFRFKCLEFDDSSFSSNFEVVLIYSTSRISICDFDSKLWWSSSSRIVVLEVAFFIWVLNWTIQFSSK